MGVCTRAHPCLPRFSSTLASLIITCQGAKRTETTTKCLTSVSNLTLPSPLGYDMLHLGVYVCWFPGSAGICLCPASAPRHVVPSKQDPARRAPAAALCVLCGGLGPAWFHHTWRARPQPVRERGISMPAGQAQAKQAADHS